MRRETWEKVREQLQVNFGMDLEGALCNSVSDITIIVYKRNNNTMESDVQFQAEITQFKNKIFDLQGQIYQLNAKVSLRDEKLKENDYEIFVLKKELDNYKKAGNLEHQTYLLNRLQESDDRNRASYQKIQQLEKQKHSWEHDYYQMKKKHESMFENLKGGGSNSPTNYEEEDKRWNIPSHSQYLVNMTPRG